MFKLEEKHIVKEGSKIVAVILPEVGEIAIKTKAKKIVDGSWLKSCTFIEHENDTTIELRSTWTLDVSVCGTALVVLHHMGYNLNDSKSIALSSKDTAKVFSKYEELIEQKPELFGAEWAEVAKNIKEKKKVKELEKKRKKEERIKAKEEKNRKIQQEKKKKEEEFFNLFETETELIFFSYNLYNENSPLYLVNTNGTVKDEHETSLKKLYQKKWVITDIDKTGKSAQLEDFNFLIRVAKKN
jgi:hypothetical protein